MNCPTDVAREVARIVQIGVLRIRSLAASSDQARRCVYEADHIHNLPHLMIDYAPELLDFYWRVERPLLIRQLSSAECEAFRESWDRLAPLVVRECQSLPALGNGPDGPLSPSQASDLASLT
jgi:hypothetical protein